MIGDQIVAPTLIFRNANPAENRYEILPGLVNQKVHFDGRVDPESSDIVSRIFQTDGYDKRLLVRMKNHPAEEFPKGIGQKSRPRNTIFHFVGERSRDGLKNSKTKKVTQKEVLMNLIKSDILCLQK